MQREDELNDQLGKAKAKLIARPSIDKKLIKDLAIANEERLLQTFDQLCRHWWDRASSLSNTAGGRLVTSTLKSHLNEPTILAVMADDVETFTKFYRRDQGDIFYLEFCCLCGSENIIKDIFLSSDNKEPLVLSNQAIGYALSSGNFSLALLLATEYLKLGKTDPGNVTLYSFGKHNEAKAIKHMFVMNTQVNSEAHHTPNDSDKGKLVF